MNGYERAKLRAVRRDYDRLKKQAEGDLERAAKYGDERWLERAISAEDTAQSLVEDYGPRFLSSVFAQ